MPAKLRVADVAETPQIEPRIDPQSLRLIPMPPTENPLQSRIDALEAQVKILMDLAQKHSWLA